MLTTAAPGYAVGPAIVDAGRQSSRALSGVPIPAAMDGEEEEEKKKEKEKEEEEKNPGPGATLVAPQPWVLLSKLPGLTLPDCELVALICPTTWEVEKAQPISQAAPGSQVCSVLNRTLEA